MLRPSAGGACDGAARHPGEAANVRKQFDRIGMRDEVVRIHEPEKNFCGLLSNQIARCDRRDRVEPLAEKANERLGARADRVRERLNGEGRIGPDGVGAHQVVEIGDEQPQCGVNFRSGLRWASITASRRASKTASS